MLSSTEEDKTRFCSSVATNPVTALIRAVFVPFDLDCRARLILSLNSKSVSTSRPFEKGTSFFTLKLGKGAAAN